MRMLRLTGKWLPGRKPKKESGPVLLAGWEMNMLRLNRYSSGVTLIELMVAMAIFGIVVAGVCLAYQAQLRSYYTQREIVDMQQNLRAGMYLMTRELKLAGLDPTGKAGAGISVANANTIAFSMDFTGGQNDGVDNDGDGLVDEGEDGLDNNGNGLIDEPDEAEWYNGSTADANEQVTYILSNDVNGNGQNDGLKTESNTGSVCHLMRNGQPIALNIDALNFVYLDGNGAVIATPVANRTAIRSVQVSIIARTAVSATSFAFSYVDDQAYQNQQPGAAGEILPAQNDSFRRISLTTEVKCRNMGLE
jgi:type IV pilus assembly protein PilW